MGIQTNVAPYLYLLFGGSMRNSVTSNTNPQMMNQNKASVAHLILEVLIVQFPLTTLRAASSENPACTQGPWSEVQGRRWKVMSPTESVGLEGFANKPARNQYD